MPHRAEQIMVEVLSRLTGLATTGDNAFRNRVHGREDTEVPALAIYQEADTPLGEDGFVNYAYLDSELTVKIVAHVKTGTAPETQLNQIRREVHVALMADYQQGIPDVVVTTIPRGTATPVLLSEGEVPTASLDIYWGFQYRSSQTDPGA